MSSKTVPQYSASQLDPALSSNSEWLINTNIWNGHYDDDYEVMYIGNYDDQVKIWIGYHNDSW